MKEHEKQLRKMTTEQLAAYWNILQMNEKMISCGESKDIQHMPIVQDELNNRGIKAERKKLLKTA